MLEVGVSGGRGRSVRDEVGVGLESSASEVEVPELWPDILETEVAMLVLEFRLELLLVELEVVIIDVRPGLSVYWGP